MRRMALHFMAVSLVAVATAAFMAVVLATATAAGQDISGTWEGPRACRELRTNWEDFDTLRFEIKVDSANVVTGRRIHGKNQGQNTLRPKESHWRPPFLNLVWKAMDLYVGVSVKLAEDGRFYGTWWTQLGSQSCRVELRRVRD
ncbi:MAG: hypothetical protein OXG58_04420 [Gemmatimonadetes bacterium]|nr:hypothetical protein [Gemmatimonadota bacterium]MCY3943176.1 hypothetical protein [Gemmatimonadota bacterium]